MKALVCVEPHHFDYKDLPDPKPEPGTTLLRIRRIGICGTDLHAFEGTQPFFTYPRILGHELAAEVVEPDPATSYKAGDTVTVIPYFNCGHCIACRHGTPNCCVQLKVFGVHIDGGMREFVRVPTGKILPANGLSLDELAILEPLAIGAHGIRRAKVHPGEFVLVAGAGPIGLCAMTFAVISGARVIALDLNQDRLEFCKKHLKVDATVAAGPEAHEQITSITHGEMPTAIIDATGSLKAIEKSFQYMAHGGRYVLVGLQKEEIKFSHPEFHKREATLMSSRNATLQEFEWAMDSIRNKNIKASDFITHRASFEDLRNSFPGWMRPEAKVIKAMVDF